MPLSLGIDIAKKKFDAALLKEDGKFKTKVFENSPKGFVALSDWLNQHGPKYRDTTKYRDTIPIQPYRRP